MGRYWSLLQGDEGIVPGGLVAKNSSPSCLLLTMTHLSCGYVAVS